MTTEQDAISGPVVLIATYAVKDGELERFQLFLRELLVFSRPRSPRRFAVTTPTQRRLRTARACKLSTSPESAHVAAPNRVTTSRVLTGQLRHQGEQGGRVVVGPARGSGDARTARRQRVLLQADQLADDLRPCSSSLPLLVGYRGPVASTERWTTSRKPRLIGRVLREHRAAHSGGSEQTSCHWPTTHVVWRGDRRPAPDES